MIFEGYPHSVSILSYNGITRVTDHDGIGNFNLICQYPIYRGCDGVYLKWLDIGAYQYWLFSNKFETQFKTKEIGRLDNDYTSRLSALSSETSRGYEVEKTISIASNHDKKYSRHIEGLISSPEIYMYTGQRYSGDNSWLKVILKEGTFNGGNNAHNTIEFRGVIDLPKNPTVVI